MRHGAASRSKETELALQPYGVTVERLHGGQPILRPTENWWEDGVTFNSAVVYLERSDSNDPLIKRLLAVETLDAPDLSDGVVVMHYRARPKHDPIGFWNRSFVGMAVYTPDLRPLKRYTEPVLAPDEDPDASDYLGVEDPRITRIGDVFYAVYCGVRRSKPEERGEGVGEWKAANCLASSRDLIHWTKYGPIQGDINIHNNKDGVLFPEQIEGRWYLLHRPMAGASSDYPIRLAASDTLTGVWHDLGTVQRALPDPVCERSWVGAGSVPISLGDQRYLVIYHTGNLLFSGEREYDLDAAIYDFRCFTPANPESIVVQRVDRMMVPETDFEVRAPFSDSVANVLFTCGTYLYRDDLYIVYGGGDTFIMAAKIRLSVLLKHLEQSASHPFYAGALA